MKRSGRNATNWHRMGFGRTALLRTRAGGTRWSAVTGPRMACSSTASSPRASIAGPVAGRAPRTVRMFGSSPTEPKRKNTGSGLANGVYQMTPQIGHPGRCSYLECADSLRHHRELQPSRCLASPSATAHSIRTVCSLRSLVSLRAPTPSRSGRQR